MSEAKTLDAPKPAVSRWYLLAVLFGIYICQSVDRAVISVIVEPLKHEFSLSDGQIGFLSGLAYSLTFAIAVLPSGWLVDRGSRRFFLASLVSIWSLCTMASAAASNYAHLVAARLGVGASEAGAVPASLSLIADTFPPRQRNTAIGIYYSATAAGQLVTFLMGGWLLTMFTWRAVFMIAGAPGLLLAALVIFTIKEPVRGAFDAVRGAIRSASEKAAKGPSMRETARVIAKSPPLVHGIMANMIATGVAFSVILWTISFLVRIHGVSVHQASIWVGLGIGLVQTVGSLLIGPIADRFSRGDPVKLALVPGIAVVCYAFCGIGMAIAPTTLWALVGMSGLAFCAGCATGPGYSLLLTLAPADARGSTLAIAKLFSILIGNGLLAYLTGAISDWVGGNDSIRVAIIATVLFQFWAAFHYFAASRTARAQARQVAAMRPGEPSLSAGSSPL